MTRTTAMLATITIAFALLGCDDKSADSTTAKPGTGAGAGVGVGGSAGSAPGVAPMTPGAATSTTRPMPGSGGVGNTGSMTPEGAESATGGNNVHGGAISTTNPTK